MKSPKLSKRQLTKKKSTTISKLAGKNTSTSSYHNNTLSRTTTRTPVCQSPNPNLPVQTHRNTYKLESK